LDNDRASTWSVPDTRHPLDRRWPAVPADLKVSTTYLPGKDPGGIIVTILLGIVGAVLGGYAGRVMGLYGPADSAGIFMSILGAVVVLLIYRLAVGGRRTI